MKSLIFSDVHANLPALEAILQREADFDEVVFLGDAVVGGPQPDDVLSLLRTLPGVFIMGNHDRDALFGDHSLEDANPDRAWIAWTREQISKANRAFLAGFRRAHTIERGALRLHLDHGVLPPELGRRLWPDSPRAAFDHLAEGNDASVLLVGHSHVQFRRDHASRTVVNPGGAGQPRLSKPVACYAILQDGRISLEATPYDVENVCRAMDRVPLPTVFVDAWKQCYRAGRLPDRYPLRRWDTLVQQGYR